MLRGAQDGAHWPQLCLMDRGTRPILKNANYSSPLLVPFYDLNVTFPNTYQIYKWVSITTLLKFSLLSLLVSLKVNFKNVLMFYCYYFGEKPGISLSDPKLKESNLANSNLQVPFLSDYIRLVPRTRQPPLHWSPQKRLFWVSRSIMSTVYTYL